MSIDYPYIPKSTSHIEQGQYWAVPLEGGGYGCGVVLAKISNQGKTDTRLFLAGVLNWFGESHPTIESISNSSVIEHGAAHIKSVTETGGQIIGSGFEVSSVTPVVENNDSISTWGYNFITKLAGKYATVNK
ncbi:MAG: Imm26 family immunity protein [Marinobacter sp.]|uniref:Imm26 family immunity protein n=1 Tax=Marinobacter sp. TaxID=50741 RepID=UPI003297B776